MRGDGAQRGLTGSLQLCRDWVSACGLDRHRYFDYGIFSFPHFSLLLRNTMTMSIACGRLIATNLYELDLLIFTVS